MILCCQENLERNSFFHQISHLSFQLPLHDLHYFCPVLDTSPSSYVHHPILINTSFVLLLCSVLTILWNLKH